MNNTTLIVVAAIGVLIIGLVGYVAYSLLIPDLPGVDIENHGSSLNRNVAAPAAVPHIENVSRPPTPHGH